MPKAPIKHRRHGDRPGRRFYKTTRWLAIRAEQLAREPLCRYHAERGEHVPADIVDHVVPHRGDEEAFFAGPFQSLCKTCHDAVKQGEERRGFRREVGLDGWPTDPRHPANGG